MSFIYMMKIFSIRRRPAAVFFFLCFASLCPAQNAAPPSRPAGSSAEERPTDQKAFQEAMRTVDLQKKQAALDAFVKAYPKSASVKTAQWEALSALIKSRPEQKQDILRRAEKLLKGTRGSTRSRYCNSIATALADAGIFLDQAEQYARKGIKATNQSKYLAEQRADYLRRKQTAPPQSSMIKRYQTTLAGSQATLGRILWKLGRKEEAEKWLTTAYAVNQTLDAASFLALAELSEAKGRKAEALDYLVQSRLSGKISADGRKKFAELYRDTHQGSTEGMEEFLDARYSQLYPNPVKHEKFSPTASRSDRVVLAELYTGAGCPPCAGADLAFDAAMERYSRSELAVVVYHLHVPRPDPMTNPDTVARGKQVQVRGTPSYAIDGKLSVGGGGRDESQEFFEERLRKPIDQRLEEPAQAKLSLEAVRDGKSVRVKASVPEIKAPSPDLQLQIALVENQIRYSGENGIRNHAMVVRSLAGFKMDGSLSAGIEHSFDLEKIEQDLKVYLDKFENENERFGKFSFLEKKSRIHREQLGVVAFLEDAKSKTVLQAVQMMLPAKKEGKSESEE